MGAIIYGLYGSSELLPWGRAENNKSIDNKTIGTKGETFVESYI